MSRNTLADAWTPPWYERWNLDPAFPIRFGRGFMRGFTPHWHELVEIVYVVSGEVRISVDGETRTASQRDIVIISSGRIHGFERTNSENELMMVQFGLDVFEQSMSELRESTSGRSVFASRTFVSRAEPELHESLESSILEIGREQRGGQTGTRLAIRARLMDLALTLLRNPPPHDAVETDDRRRRSRNETLSRVFEFVSARFAEPVTLDDAAEAAHLSRYYFSRFFREQTGLTFHRYLSRIRVGRAERLLVQSQMPVTDIALNSGFSNLKTFNRVFRQLTGCSPTEYRSASIVLG